jgi:hypothetical protein
MQKLVKRMLIVIALGADGAEFLLKFSGLLAMILVTA